MKKILTLAFSLFAVVALNAQDLESATNTYNEAANALNAGDKESALNYFKKALADAEVIGPEAEELANNCKKYIPVVTFSIGKEKAANGDYDGGIALMYEAAEIAEEYGQDDVKAEALDLIPQVYMQQGNLCLNNKSYAEAVENYKKVVEIKPNDGNAWLRLGQASSRVGDETLAVEALQKAAELGQKNAAEKALNSFYVGKANASLKAKNYTDALENAEKSLQYADNAAAHQIAGTAAVQLKNSASAIEHFKAFLELSPNAKNADQIKYQLATSYEALNDKDNACLYYKAILNNPQFKEYAKHKIENELKCK